MRYIVELPHGHYALQALRECQALYATGSPSWLGDLAIVIRRIPHHPPVFHPLHLTADSIDILISDVKHSMELHIDTAISASSKGQLLQGRMETDDDGHLVHMAMHF